eukprot:8492248-Karenia_brevis.AAC.1
MGMGNITIRLGQLHSTWSTQATVLLASKSESALAEIIKKVGYGQKALSKMHRARVPDEMEMYQHQGIAWVVAAQSIIRLCRRSKERHPCHEIYEHQVGLQQKAEALGNSYTNITQ